MKEYLLNEIKKKIESWDKDDIYAISLYVYDYQDNPCQPTVTLGYNTNQHYKSQIPKAYAEIEARWNYAFWLQNEELVFGVEETEEIVKEWILKNGFQYYTCEEVYSDIEIDDGELEKITKAFVKTLVEIVKELHQSGFIKEQFGKEIPILVHELEYYEEIERQNVEANPRETIEEFLAFCKWDW